MSATEDFIEKQTILNEAIENHAKMVTEVMNKMNEILANYDDRIKRLEELVEGTHGNMGKN